MLLVTNDGAVSVTAPRPRNTSGFDIAKEFSPALTEPNPAASSAGADRTTHPFNGNSQEAKHLEAIYLEKFIRSVFESENLKETLYTCL